MYEELTQIEDARVEAVLWSERYLRFKTDKGDITYEVFGDCCSHSYFHDFYGVTALIGKTVTKIRSIELNPVDNTRDEDGFFDDYTQVYGYALDYEDPKFGTRSAVFSFRNESNGYYGGWMEFAESSPAESTFTNIVDDVIGD